MKDTFDVKVFLAEAEYETAAACTTYLQVKFIIDQSLLPQWFEAIGYELRQMVVLYLRDQFQRFPEGAIAWLQK